MFAGFSIDFHDFPVIVALNMNQTVSDNIDWKIHNCFLSQSKVKLLNKILPLVLVLSVSLIIGYQAAFATEQIWAPYCEVNGAKVDATTNGAAGSSNVNKCAETHDAFNVGSPVSYQNIENANISPGLTGDLMIANCFRGNQNFPIVNPKDNPDFAWNLGFVDVLNCVQNQRASNDLGLGVDEPVIVASQPLELQNDELIVIDLTALNKCKDFKFRLSSNTNTERAWVGVSDTPPTGIVADEDFTLLAGSIVDSSISSTDVYIPFPKRDYLYVTEVSDGGDNLFQQIRADCPDDVVGGHGGPIDKTALMVTGAQLNASWMIPVLVSAIGIGLFVVTRKS